MSERYSKLFSLPTDLYEEGAPVIIAGGNLLKDNQTGRVLAQLKIKSIAEKTIKAATVFAHALDTKGAAIEGDAKQEYLDLSVKQGEDFGQKTAIRFPNASTRAFSVEVKQVVFTDNSTWEPTGKVWEPLPADESLSRWLGDVELLRQYKNKFGDRCEVVPQEHRDLWRCACGSWNRADRCYACGKEKSALLGLDLTALRAERDQRLAKEKAEREAQEAAAAEQAKKTKKVLAIVIPALAVVLTIFLLVTKVVIPNNKYNEAMALLDAGRYEEAITALEALDGYKDSIERITVARETQIEAENKSAYKRAESLLAKGNTYEAALAFYQCKDYYEDALARCFHLWDELVHRETLSAGLRHTVGLRGDGSVVAIGDNYYGQCDVSGWKDIVAIAAGNYHTLGLRADGTVVAVGYIDDVKCELSKWKDVVAIAAGESHTVGLRADGTVVAVGNYGNRCNVNGWKDIVAIAAGEWHTVGLRADGTVVAVGDNDDGQCDVSDWKDIVAIAAGEWHTVGLRADGTVVAVGDNDDGQCKVSEWKDIVAIAAGGYHTVGLKADGTVVAVGDNDDGQCRVSEWKTIITISAGGFHTMGLKADGTVVAVGENYAGQCDVSGWRSIKLPN